MYRKFRNHVVRLSYMAFHDELTGVYNCAGYEHLLSALDFESTYIMLVDVDNFKGVNDTFGHDAGDKILTKIVKLLKIISDVMTVSAGSAVMSSLYSWCSLLRE